MDAPSSLALVPSAVGLLVVPGTGASTGTITYYASYPSSLIRCLIHILPLSSSLVSTDTSPPKENPCNLSLSYGCRSSIAINDSEYDCKLMVPMPYTPLQEMCNFPRRSSLGPCPVASFLPFFRPMVIAPSQMLNGAIRPSDPICTVSPSVSVGSVWFVSMNHHTLCQISLLNISLPRTTFVLALQ